MSRWKSRRQKPAAGLTFAAIDLPPETPDDVRDLARTACREAGRILANFSPDDAGLVLVHPRSCACPDPQARAGRVFATVEPRDRLEELAGMVNLDARRRPGWFSCLLVGIECSGFCYLAHPSRLAFEQGAS